MPMYRLRYKTPSGQRPSTQCYARDDEHLVEVIKLRGLGEVRDDPEVYTSYNAPEMPSTLLRAGKHAEANHALIWVSMIATKAGLVEAFDLFNDFGVVHEMAHILHLDGIGRTSQSHYDAAVLLPRVEAFERSVPGVHPCWAGGDLSVPRRDNPMRDYQRVLEMMMTPPAAMLIELKTPGYGHRYPTPALDFPILAKPKTPSPMHGKQRDFEKQSREQAHRARTAGKADLLAKMKTLKVAPQAPDPGTMMDLSILRPKGITLAEAAALPIKGIKLHVGGMVTGRTAHTIPNPPTPLADRLRRAIEGKRDELEDQMIVGKRADMVIMDDPAAARLGSPTGRMLPLFPPPAGVGKAPISTASYLQQADFADAENAAVLAAYKAAGYTVVHDEVQIEAQTPAQTLENLCLEIKTSGEPYIVAIDPGNHDQTAIAVGRKKGGRIVMDIETGGLSDYMRAAQGALTAHEKAFLAQHRHATATKETT